MVYTTIFYDLCCKHYSLRKEKNNHLFFVGYKEQNHLSSLFNLYIVFYRFAKIEQASIINCPLIDDTEKLDLLDNINITERCQKNHPLFHYEKNKCLIHVNNRRINENAFIFNWFQIIEKWMFFNIYIIIIERQRCNQKKIFIRIAFQLFAPNLAVALLNPTNVIKKLLETLEERCLKWIEVFLIDYEL